MILYFRCQGEALKAGETALFPANHLLDSKTFIIIASSSL